MKKQFNIRLVGVAFVLLLVSALSSCTTADGYTHYPFGIGASCAVNGFPAFPGSPAPCVVGGQPVMYQQPGCYSQGYGNEGFLYPPGDYGPPFQIAGHDMNGDPFYGRYSRSGNYYEVGNGPDGSVQSNPRGQLRYRYYPGVRDGWQQGGIFGP
ncbi:MAG TPA: hypothetical protein VGE62_02220 [Candidatus Paceibacterota bacterium]